MSSFYPSYTFCTSTELQIEFLVLFDNLVKCFHYIIQDRFRNSWILLTVFK